MAAMQIPNEIQRVIRLIMLLRRQRGCKGFKFGEGGLMVLLWCGQGTSYRTNPRMPDVACGPMGSDSVYGSVAAAGPWCEGVTTGGLKPGFTELLQKLFPSEVQCPEPDPEELCSFTHMHGPIHFLITFQVKGVRPLDQRWHFHVGEFLHQLSLTNARVKVHLGIRSYEKRLQRMFSGKIHIKLTLKDQWSTFLDVTATKPWLSMGERPWCRGGHPVTGGQLSLSIPSEAMERGLYGELCLQPVALLSPCVLQYPNLATCLTRIQAVVYSPSNVPVARPPPFLQQLLVHLDCEELGIDGVLRCPTPTELLQSGRIAVAVDRETGGAGGCGLASVEQSLTLCLFLHHMDPFTSELSDLIGTEELLEHHLESILSNNRLAVTAALHGEIKNILSAHRQRSKATEKMGSAFCVTVSSALSIVSSSTNLEFRSACLNTMRVHDTHGLSLALREAQVRVTSWKFVQKGVCHSHQEDHLLQK